MEQQNQTKFLEMFPFCKDQKSLCGGLDGAFAERVQINREKLEMSICVRFLATPEPSELRKIEERIAAEYGLANVSISCAGEASEATQTVETHQAAKPPKAEENHEPKPPESVEKPSATKPEAGEKKASAADGKKLYGKAVRRKPVEIGTLSPESGLVCVSGEIFAVDSRPIQKRDGWVLSFGLTDYTGSVKVSKYFTPQDELGSLKTLRPGMSVTVYGNASYDRYEQDTCLQPVGVFLQKKAERMDTAAEKRVELHLHTRFSAMDALTDPEQAVSRAAQWGHSAVAITDHGVAQAFPEAWKAGKKAGIKVIFGIEGYYINDVDDKSAATASSGALSDEYVAFDIETTGLSSFKDRITEIGAVIMRGGEVAERFQTFVNPHMPIPIDIVRLTGITDADVKDAPDEAQALKSFLAFAGNRPLAAHNAEFDLGFMTAAAGRCGVPFSPVCLDTLTLAQALLPDMKRFKLNLVAERLGLPEFNHHRATDDAAACGKILARFVEMLAKRGITDFAALEDFTRRERNAGLKGMRTRHIILLVKNKTGLKNLYELISKSHLEHFRKNPIIPKSLLMRHREGLIIGSACMAGEIFDAVLEHKSFETLERLCAFYDYLEIQPICNNAFLIDDGRVKNEEELRDFNRRIVEIGQRLGKPVAATGDVHFLDPQQEAYRRVLLNGKGYSDADRPMPIYFKTTGEMLEEFKYLGGETCRKVVIETPAAIADMCEEIELLPKKLFPPTIENSREDLEKLVRGTMARLYGENPPPVVKDRVEAELKDIIDCKYDVIYMSAQKLVANSLEAGYLVGSRGSVGSSVVAFLAGITEVNALAAHYRCPKCRYSDFESGAGYGCGADMPDKTCPVCGENLQKDGFDIPFETFLGFGGDKIPDIDLNFSGEYQAQAHKFTAELFGRDHVFRAGTINTLAEKNARGYVRKYLEQREKIVSKAEETRLALGCVGVKRTTGQHPGGQVIIPQDMDVTDFCPVQHPADDTDSETIITHFEYHCMEDNLLKLDELGHDDPTMIKMLEDLTKVSARDIPLDDKDTMRIFLTPEPLGLPETDPIIGKTGTIGIPEFGTAFTRQMLVDTRPEDFDTLVKLSGFSHGTDVWAGNIRELILAKTATVKQTASCRDDIMLYLISLGIEPKRAFQFMEAVRKGAIHKGKKWPDGIVEEMRSLGVPEWYVESCRKIQYLFPKAHAVAYVMMAFRIAYFKVHHPLAYYSCYFYRRSDSFDAVLMTRGIEPVRRKINEIKASDNATVREQEALITLEAVYEFYLRGFSFEHMDIYRSRAAQFVIAGNCLIPPFAAIAGLGEAAASDLENCNKTGRQFISIEELSSACPKVSKTHIEQLKELGALGTLPETSQMSLF